VCFAGNMTKTQGAKEPKARTPSGHGVVHEGRLTPREPAASQGTAKATKVPPQRATQGSARKGAAVNTKTPFPASRKAGRGR
jgi:hypothetical protein